jgi:8-oxo-dGTP diphosphatase
VGALDGWRFCPRCAGALAGEARRLECASCGFVAYANPVPGAEVVIHDDAGRILLGRRAFEPSAGLWDLPGGFVEEGEDPLDALRREVREETALELEDLRFLGFYQEPYGGRIVLCLTWTGRGVGQARAGDDLVEVRWFEPRALPSPPELAFTHYAAVLSTAVAGASPRSDDRGPSVDR